MSVCNAYCIPAIKNKKQIQFNQARTKTEMSFYPFYKNYITKSLLYEEVIKTAAK